MATKNLNSLCIIIFICFGHWTLLNCVYYLNTLEKFNEESNENILVLPEMTKYLSQRNESKEAIFYTETSGNATIKARFVCAIECAARTNPESDIYLILLVPSYQLNLNENLALDFVLKYYKNIQVLACDLNILFKNSFLQNDMYFNGKLNSSRLNNNQLNNLIKFYVLWKYGGKYFDLGLFLIKQIPQIKNMVIEENKNRNSFCTGILAFEKDSTVSYEILKKYTSNFNANIWNPNPQHIVFYTFMEICKLSNFTSTLAETCQDITYLKNERFFPINWEHLYLYFDQARSNETMQMIDSQMDYLYGFHIGYNLSKNKVVNISSKQPYSLLAQRYCPRSYWSCDKVF